MTGHRAPPFARWLLSRVVAADMCEAILGDLAESDAPPLAYWREIALAPRTWLAPRPFIGRDHHQLQGESMLSQIQSDVRFAWRSMLMRKGMTAVTVGTLALGIGASTAIFSAVHPILVRTLPYPNPDRLTTIWERARDGGRSRVGYATFDDIKRNARSFDAVAVSSSMSATMTTAGAPRPFTGRRVSPDYFRVFGVAPMLGRIIGPQDDVRGTPNVLVLSHNTWRDAFGADRGIIDKLVTLDGDAYTVVGVMSEGFEDVLSPEAQIWAPLRYEIALPWACRTCRHLGIIARRGETVSEEQAKRELEVIAANAFRDHPTQYSGAGILTQPMAENLTEEIRPAMLALLGAVLVVLLVASLNVSNLLLARGAARRGEFAIRAALGAGRGRLIRQLLTESVVLALAGGALGVGLAFVGVRGMVALSPPDLPRLAAISVNGPVLLFALVVTTIVGIVFGLVPAWQGAGNSFQASIRQGARGLVGADRRLRAFVVVAEVALALVLLVGSGLLYRSMDRLLAVNPGFEPERLMTLQVQAGSGAMNTDTLVRLFYQEALRAVRARPEVAGAAFTSQLPLSGDFDGIGVHLESRPTANPADSPSAFRYAVSAGYFETMQIPLVRGRLFVAADDERAARVAVVNAAFASRHFGEQDPIGNRVKVGGGGGPWREIVGVVGDVRQLSLEGDAADAIYLPESQWRTDYTRSLVVRARIDPSALAGPLRETIWSVDKDQPVLRLRTGDALIAATAADRRFALVLFEGFGIVALLLAATGIYGVLIGGVTERRRELGVRAAFGASATELVWLVVRQGMTMTIIGVGAGLILAATGTRALSGMLFGVSALDPVTFGAVTIALIVVALLACWVPAYRASRTDPMESLRAE